MGTYNQVEREKYCRPVRKASLITLTILQLRFVTQQVHLGQRPLPVESYISPSIDVPRFVNSRKRLAGSKSEIQQIRPQINLGGDIATVNDGKRTESTDGNLHCNFTLQSNVSTVTYDKADAERNEPKLLVSFHAIICHKCDSSCD